MRLLMLAILLGFPVLDVVATVHFARWSGVPVWLWLALSLTAGLLILASERQAFRSRTVAALHGDQSLLRGLLDSGRKILAALLLILPGIVSDFLALLLLAFPINTGRRYPLHAMATSPLASDTITGEYRRID